MDPQPQEMTGFSRVDELPPPEALFALNLPYIMILQMSDKRIRIQGSHAGSLQRIKDYFQPFTRRNHNDTRNPPYIKFQLETSYLTAADHFDTLIIEPFDGSGSCVDVNPVFILSFIEGSLGYRQTRHDGYMLAYRRDEPFAA